MCLVVADLFDFHSHVSLNTYNEKMRAIEIDDEDMQNIEEPDCVDIEEAVSLREIKSLQLSLAGSSEDTQLGKLFWKIDVKKDNETYQIQRTYS